MNTRRTIRTGLLSLGLATLTFIGAVLQYSGVVWVMGVLQ